MTAPTNTGSLTFEEALAIAASAQAALTSADVVTSSVSQLAEQVISVREAAADWATNLIIGLWRDVDPYVGNEVQAFTEAAAEYMATAQTTVVRAAAASQQRQLATMGVQTSATPSNPLDVRGTPVVADDGTITVGRGTSNVTYQDGGRRVVDLDEDATTVGMFNRPARVQRYLESKGVGSVEARVAAEDRLSLLVGDNVMLAQRLAEAEIIAQAASIDERITGLRRVIHPELSRTGVCGLCIAAADRIYKVADLMPIHDRCKCTAAAVTDEFDPADELNSTDLGELYRLSSGTSAAELKRLRYQVDEHGELGPVLIPARKLKPRKPQEPARRRRTQPIPSRASAR